MLTFLLFASYRLEFHIMGFLKIVRIGSLTIKKSWNAKINAFFKSLLFLFFFLFGNKKKINQGLRKAAKS